MIRRAVWIYVIALFPLANSLAQTGPGGVGNSTSNILHLKAEVGTSTTTNGTSLGAWNDQSGNGNNASASGGAQPTYKTLQINGFPTISFNGSSNYMSFTPFFPTGASSDYTKFVVGRLNGTAPNNNWFSGQSDHAFFMSSGSQQIKLFHNGTIVNSSISVTLGSYNILSGTVVASTFAGEVFVNGSSGGTGSLNHANADANVFLGAYGAGANLLNGDMSEVIAYNIKLNTAQRTIVENYLAAKYALTISNSKYNYASTHPNEVVGIGRNDATNLHLAARSAKILDISEPTAATFANGDYIVTGHDGASAGSWTTTEVPTTTSNIRRLPREWRMTKTGTIATATLGIDNSILPALPPSYTTYVVMVDADGDFTSGATVYEMPLVSGSSYARTAIPIADGNYVTVGVAIPTIQFTSTTTTAFENAAVAIQVSLNYNAATAVTANYASTPGSAGTPGDYTLSSGTATISSGSSTTTILPTLVNDAVFESDETFTVTLSSPSAGAVLGANTTNTYTIHDDDSARKIDFSVASSSAAESVTSVSLTIRIPASDTNPTTVDYSVTGGTATGGGVDFTLASGTATIIAGSTTIPLNFTVVNDAIFENNETIIITLTNPTNSVLGTNYVYTYTINDDDGPEVIGFTTTSFSGPESTATVNFPVSLSVTSSFASSVNYTVTGTATGGGADYTLANGTLTIPAGNLSGTITATVVNDSFVEGNETIIVTLSSPVNCTLGSSVSTYTILDDDTYGYTGPGGVGDNLTNILWLRADKGTSTTTDGVGVQTWNDQSGNAYNAQQATSGKRPLYKAGLANGLATLRFDGSNSVLIGPNVFPTNSDYTKFAVVNISNSGATNNVISGVSGHAFYFSNTTSPRLFQSGTSFAISPLTFTVGSYGLMSGTFVNSTKVGQVYVNGATGGGGSGTAPNTNTDNQLQIGAYAGGNYFQGDIAEVLAYNNKLNSAQRVIVENYLASKYALTITNDKYSFDGTFGFEVAGIGRDDSNDLHTDAKGSGLVRINSASSLDDGDYLLWGHNNGAITASNTSDVPSGIVSRMVRVWRTDQPAATSVGTVTISFDVTGFTIASGNDIELLIASSGSGGVFNTATRFTTGRTYNAGTHIIQFTTASFPAGTYFTLGSNSASSTLPIKLISFDAVADHETNSVLLNWKTATELNNNFFTVQRSTDGSEWAEILQVPGAGTSTDEHSYYGTDLKPIEGVSYYRLTQTDFDGKTTFSKIVTVSFDQTDFLAAYPNPSNELLTISTKSPAAVYFMNSTGSVLFSGVVSKPTKINTADLPSGLYIVKTNDDKGVITKKVVIVH